MKENKIIIISHRRHWWHMYVCVCVYRRTSPVMNLISGWISLGASCNKAELIGTPRGLLVGFIYYELGQRGADDPRRVHGLISFYFVRSLHALIFSEGPRDRTLSASLPRAFWCCQISYFLYNVSYAVNATWLEMYKKISKITNKVITASETHNAKEI